MKEYILYGTGVEGEKFIFQNFDLISKIDFCIDRFREGNFHNIPIKKLEEITDINHIIIIAAIWEKYLKIKEILELRGMVEFENFIWSFMFRKKLVVINANCHGRALVNYLRMNNEFQKNI